MAGRLRILARQRKAGPGFTGRAKPCNPMSMPMSDSTPPAVSVIIPTFDRAELVGRAVASVLAQTHADLECLVVDDGSRDHTPEVLAAMGDPRLRVWRTQNRGVSAARNLGLAESRGEYVAFLDSDDEWLPEKLARQLAFMVDGGLSASHTEEIWMRGGRRVNPGARYAKPTGDIFTASLDLCVISPSCSMFARSLFARVGTFDPDLPACEDYDLWLRVCLAVPVGFWPEKLTIRHGGREDQLSRRIAHLDLYRVYALLKLLKNAVLTDRQREAAEMALRTKAGVYVQGCLKRGRQDEAARVRALVAEATGRL